MQPTDQDAQSLQSRSRGFLMDVERLDFGPATGLFARFDRQNFDDLLFEALGIVRPDRLGTAVTKRRAEFLAGRALGQTALSLVGKQPDHIGIGAHREPLWPEGIAGSITHSSMHCAAIVCDQTGMLVGIDIEDVAQGSSLDAIFKVALMPDETRLIRSECQLSQKVLATLTFSAKETLYKALFPLVGRFFGFDYAELVGPPLDDKVQLRLTKPLSPRLEQGTMFDIKYRVASETVTTWLVTPAPGI